jgi:phosphate transport system protein
MSRHLQKDIEKLKEKIIEMGGMVEDRVYQATMSIINRDSALAKAVINGDAEIDSIEVAIEEECLKILALYQPVAIDLRFIVAVMKINNDLERVGDLAVNIAERSAFLATQPPIEFPFNLQDMAEKTESMLTRSIDALVNLNVKEAYLIRSEDDQIDAYNRDMYNRIRDDFLNQPENINSQLHAVSIGRHLERIADHATNIAEEVIYLAEAKIVRHKPEVYKE